MTAHSAAPREGLHAGGFAPWQRRLAWLCAACLSAWWLLPVLTSTHVEGFSAQIESLARLLWERHPIAGHDLARPLVSEFIFVTRPGVIDLLALSNAVFGYGGDLGFRVLIAASALALLVASAAVAVRHARVSWATALWVAMLTPGLVELGFYFNDNIVSAAFAAMALAALSLPRATGAALVSGLLLGCATLSRLDAVLVAPLVVLVFLLRQNGFWHGWLRLAMLALSAFAVHAVAAPFNNVDVRDALRVTRLFAEKHMTGHGYFPGAVPLLYFFGLVVPVLVVLGARSFWSSRPGGWRAWAWGGAFYAYPLLLATYAVGTSTEIRYFLPLLCPFIVLHAAVGWATLLACLRGGRTPQRRMAQLFAAVALCGLLAPPAEPLLRDGPRVLVGRGWSPLLWRRWQASVDQGMSNVRQVVRDVALQPVATVVSTHGNDEFYLRLRLFEAGFHETPVREECRPLSRYEDGRHVVWHVRAWPAYELAPFDTDTAVALVLSAVERCAELQSSTSVWAMGFGGLPAAALDNGFRESDLPGTALRPFPGRPLQGLAHEERFFGATFPLVTAAPMPMRRLREIGRVALDRIGAQAGGSGQSQQAMVDLYESGFRIPRH